MSVSKEQFGTTKDGVGVTKFTITNKNGMSISLLDFGAIVQAIHVPDKNGKTADIALGFDDIAGYEVNNCYFGAFVGRHANRIGGAFFDLNGTGYQLQKNDGENNLHGGDPGFHKVMYRGDTAGESSVYFERVSPNGEQGFPGAMEVKVTYTLTDDNEFKIEYFARSDADTIYNPTNHTYFNFLGHDGGDITKHEVEINADAITESGVGLIPNGNFIQVEGTPFDFRQSKKVFLDIEADDEQLKNAGGYDHNFCLKKQPREYGYAGKVFEETTGRGMEIYTDLPGMQFYTGNFIGNEKGKDGAVYTKRTGMCFETQFFPNAVNVPAFTSCYLPKGEAFHSTTVYKFSW